METQQTAQQVAQQPKAPSLKQSIDVAWGRFDAKEKLFVVFSFVMSFGFTLYGMWPTLISGNYTFLNVMSLMMSTFGFLGTWTLVTQWQHTFKVNGVQNISAIIVAFMQGIYSDALVSFYYLITEFIGDHSWKKKRNDKGELQVDKTMDAKKISLTALFWTVLLAAISFVLGGARIILDAITNGLAFAAQQRQVTGHIDGYYLWLAVDVFSFILWMSVGNPIVAFSYAGMFFQGMVGIMVWKKGKSL